MPSDPVAATHRAQPASTAARNRTNAAWLRAQLEDLAGHLAFDARHWSLDQQRRALMAIARGESWRIGALP